MKVEILFPELCSLFGDHGNILFLKDNLDNSNIYETALKEEPKFFTEKIDFLYMGAMSENTQKLVIKKLMPYKEILLEKVNDGMKVLFTGNAADILGKIIIEENLNVWEGLSIFDFETKITIRPRINDVIFGHTKDGLEIVAHKTQFTQSYGNNKDNYFVKTKIGMGSNKETNLEGFVYKGLIATNLTGPLLVLNPDFAKAYLGIDVKHEATYLEAKHKKILDLKEIQAN